MILRKEPVQLSLRPPEGGKITFIEVPGFVCAEVGLAVTPRYPLLREPVYEVTHVASGLRIVGPFPNKVSASNALADLAVFDWRNVMPTDVPDEYRYLARQVAKGIEK